MAWIRSNKKGSGGGLNAVDCNIRLIDLGGGEGVDAVDFNIQSVDLETNQESGGETV